MMCMSSLDVWRVVVFGDVLLVRLIMTLCCVGVLKFDVMAARIYCSFYFLSFRLNWCVGVDGGVSMCWYCVDVLTTAIVLMLVSASCLTVNVGCGYAAMLMLMFVCCLTADQNRHTTTSTIHSSRQQHKRTPTLTHQQIHDPHLFVCFLTVDVWIVDVLVC